jgi:hypothetical protein
MVFTADGTVIDAGDAPMPALPLKKLKEFMRQISEGKADYSARTGAGKNSSAKLTNVRKGARPRAPFQIKNPPQLYNFWLAPP